VSHEDGGEGAHHGHKATQRRRHGDPQPVGEDIRVECISHGEQHSLQRQIERVSTLWLNQRMCKSWSVA
jgi:hypothetical protein